MQDAQDTQEQEREAESTTDSQQPGDGYFAPDSVSRLLYADPSSKLGGVAGLLLQSLSPVMMHLFSATSSYATDVEGRGERTGRYIDTLTFGDRAHADAAANAVRRMHARATWTDPMTGHEWRADDQPLLAWTHNALVYGVLRAADEYGPELSPADQDRFVVEQHVAAGLAGVTDKALLPASRADLEAYVDEMKDRMALTLPAAEVSRALRKPDLSGNPVAVIASVSVQDGILWLLPDWARLLLGIEGRPMNLRAAAGTTRRLIERARSRRSATSLIDEAVSRVQTHPYRRVRGDKKA